MDQNWPLRSSTFPRSRDISISSHELPDDDAEYVRRHPGEYEPILPPTATSEDSRVTLFYHGYATHENRHWVDDEVLSSGDETVRNEREDAYTERTPMALEAQVPSGAPAELGASESDPNLIDWTGPDDPLHPHNWPAHRRWTSTVLIAMFA